MVTLSIRMNMLAFAVVASCIGSGSSVYVLVQHYANENCTGGKGALMMEEALSPDAEVAQLLSFKNMTGCQQVNGDQLQEVLGGQAVKFVADDKDGSCKLTVFSDGTCGAEAATRPLFTGTCKKRGGQRQHQGQVHATVQPSVSAPVAARAMAPRNLGGVSSVAGSAQAEVATNRADNLAATLPVPAPAPPASSTAASSHKDGTHSSHDHKHDEHHKDTTHRHRNPSAASVVHQCKSGPVPEGVWDATCVNATLLQDVFMYFYSKRMFREGEDKVACLRSCNSELAAATSKKAFDALFSEGGCAASCSAEVKAIARQKQVREKSSDCQFRAKKVVEQPVPEIMV